MSCHARLGFRKRRTHGLDTRSSWTNGIAAALPFTMTVEIAEIAEPPSEDCHRAIASSGMLWRRGSCCRPVESKRIRITASDLSAYRSPRQVAT